MTATLRIPGWTFALVLALCLPCATAAASDMQGFRLDIVSGAVVKGPMVTLGEIAHPMGDITQADWNMLSAKELWPAPDRAGTPMAISKDKLRRALEEALGTMAGLCILPDRLVIQTGGRMIPQEELASMVVSALTPYMNSVMAQNPMAEPELREYDLPDQVFVSDSMNNLVAKPARDDIKPGRVPIHFEEIALNGDQVRKTSASVFLDLWVDVPAAARPLNRGDILEPQDVTTIRKNLAYINGELWDGQGGPWRLTRSVGTSQELYSTSLEPLPLVLRGDTVSLVYEGAYIRLEVPAEVMADAGYGDAVTVRNLESDRQVVAKVRDANTVVVH